MKTVENDVKYPKILTFDHNDHLNILQIFVHGAGLLSKKFSSTGRNRIT